MAEYQLAWVNTGKPERELALEYGLKRVCIIPAGTDTSVLEKLVESANLWICTPDRNDDIDERDHEIVGLKDRIEELEQKISDARDALED